MLETALKVIAQGVYTTLLFQEEQLLGMARRTIDEENILSCTRKSLRDLEPFLDLRPAASVPSSNIPGDILPGSILDKIRTGNIPVNTSMDEKELVIGMSAPIEITEDDEVIDIINTPDPRSNLVQLQPKK
jgi:hypothetical protein